MFIRNGKGYKKQPIFSSDCAGRAIGLFLADPPCHCGRGWQPSDYIELRFGVKPMLSSVPNQSGDTVNVQFRHKIGLMSADRLDAKAQFFCDFLAGLAGHKQEKHLQFAV